ncbi:DUF4898 domain-containing protein [Metallosphaera tengchongensis]|uniref:DUF4898 domain-containing protein n=1 Tax=Metallosphaera tengchongensis TaxID=1532350 RepID=A0A6N0NVJ5_9CREN|nr:DUF4898 domain-containing protein [Metallosphaera tengchongensis]QKR00914.1 DUF4898 domain-containing protein [Metallosphaera tengchongensis]
MPETMERRDNVEIEPELLTLLSSLGVNSSPKRIPLKTVSSLEKILSLILPKNVSDMVIVLSKDHVGSQGKFSSATRAAFPSSKVTVLFSHKLDKDVTLVYFK